VSSLSGKSAIVTGASRGIGLAIARALAREDVRLGFLSRSRPDVGGEFVACDLADLERIPDAIRQLVERLGTVDFLINNAGTFLEKAVPEIQLADWERVLHVNLTAPFLLTREVLPLMIARRQGRIVNIARGTSTNPLTAPANMACSASVAAWRSKPNLTTSTSTPFVPAAWTPTSSKAPTWASASKASR
jgi:NAD(P)-dependent dehydrogenase (short-subunit alcohol dehydrogenase family)